MSVSFLSRQNAPALAYRHITGKGGASLLFLPGFRSDMNGSKASYLASWAAESGLPLYLMDYRGHGASEGRFIDGTIGLWLEDVLDVMDDLTDGPLIVIGSSMGGWLGLLAALRRTERVKALIGLAAAPDFTREFKSMVGEAQRAELAEKGYFTLANDYSDHSYEISRALMEDGDSFCLLDGPIAIRCPVRLIQGKQDRDVPWETAFKIEQRLESPDKKVILREYGDHGLSRPEDLAVLSAVILELLGD